jgi:hypothetical protein
MTEQQPGETGASFDLPPSVVRGLAAGLTAMRHCAPGAELGRPTHPTHRALLEELLALPDHVDPIRWLREERGDTVARLTLRAALLALRQEYESHRARPGPRTDLPAWAREFWDDMARAWAGSLEGADPFVGLGGVADDPDRLRQILGRVRRLRPRYAGPSGMMPAGDLPRLIDDLLQLPDELDPLRWLRDERSELGARMTLSDVVMAAWPARGLAVGNPISRLQPRQRFALSGRAELVVEELALRPRGFSITVTVRTSREDVPLPPGTELGMLRWQGFDQVRDDRGYRYLIVAPGDTVTLFGSGDEERYTITYHPAIAEGATALTFSSTPTRFAALGVSAEGPRTLPDLELADVVWRVELPR